MDMKQSTAPSSNGHSGKGWDLLFSFLAMLAAGVAGNYFNFQIFLNIDFLFGSIFALLALQRFGLRLGLVAAALISAYTFTLWNHPYACIILTAEVAVVGLLSSRRRIGLVMADTLYWLCIGMPLIYLFYHGVMDVSWENTRIVMTKQAVNGITNALIAHFLFAGYTRLSGQQLLPFREILSTLFGLFVLCPALLILAIDSRADFAAIDRQILTMMIHDREVMSERLENWLNYRKASIVTLANLASTLSPQQMQDRLEQAKNSDPNFLRVALIDQGASIVAVSPLTDELGHDNIGRNYADRPFIPLLQKNLQPMLSEVVMARIGTIKPVAHILAPVVTAAGYGGYVLGALNLERFEKILEMNATREGQHFILLDRHGKIITTNDKEQKVMAPLLRSQGRIDPLEGGVARWIPTLPDNTPIMERWKKSYYITEATIGALSEWTLMLEQPVAPFQKQLYDIYTRKLTLLFLIFLVALLFAEYLSRLMTQTHEELRNITSDLPNKVASGYPIVWPESAILETKHLIKNFQAMTVTLSAQFSDIRKINASLEERVGIRTRELLESRQRYDLALLGSQDGIWDWNVLTGEVYFSERWFEALGYEVKELPNTIDLFKSLIHPDELKLVLDRISLHLKHLHPYSVEYRIRRKDGEYSWIFSRGQALWNEEGWAVRMAGSHTDITERKRFEVQLLCSLREKEVLLKEIHHRVKNNLQIVHSLLVLQANSIADQEIRTLFEESRNRIGSMALIHEKLYRSKDLSHIDFSQYLQELTQNISCTYQQPEINIIVGREPIFLDINSGIPCGLIVNELVSNSFKHAFPARQEGQITVVLTRPTGKSYLLTVADNGGGFPDAIDFRNTTSLGMQLVSVLTEQLQGTIELYTDAGTRFTISFPGRT